MKHCPRLQALFLFSLAVLPTWAQFDYLRRESPSVSWNGNLSPDATAMGGANIGLLAAPYFAGLYNPAYTVAGHKLQPAVSLNFLRHTAFQYGGVNQGVFSTDGAPGERLITPSAALLTLSAGRFHLAAGLTAKNLFDKPDITLSSRDDSQAVTRSFRGEFQGRADALFVAAAAPVGTRLKLGLRLEQIWGTREVDTRQEDPDLSVYAYRERSRWSYPAVQLGLHWRNPRLQWAASWYQPMPGDVARTLSRRFSNPAGPTIENDQAVHDPLERPARFALETSVQIRPGWTLAAGADQTFWRDYQFTYFGQHMPREMRDTNTLSLAVGKNLASLGSWRLGVRYDPQPLRSEDQTLTHYHAGLSWVWGRLDAAMAVSYTTGDSQYWQPEHLAVSYSLAWRRN